MHSFINFVSFSLHHHHVRRRGYTAYRWMIIERTGVVVASVGCINT